VNEQRGQSSCYCPAGDKEEESDKKRSEWELFGTKAFILALSPVAQIRWLVDVLNDQYEYCLFDGD
jgi:hypothetical protein